MSDTRTCYNCGAAIAEQGAHCEACGATQEAGAAGHEPSASLEDLPLWLTEHGFSHLVGAFAENDVDRQVIEGGLSDEDLQSIGVKKLGDRKRLLRLLAPFDRRPADQAPTGGNRRKKSASSQSRGAEAPTAKSVGQIVAMVVAALLFCTGFLPWVEVKSSISGTGMGRTSDSFTLFGITTWFGEVGLALAVAAFMCAKKGQRGLVAACGIGALVWALYVGEVLLPEMSTSTSTSTDLGALGAFNATARLRFGPHIGLVAYLGVSVIVVLASIFAKSPRNYEDLVLPEGDVQSQPFVSSSTQETLTLIAGRFKTPMSIAAILMVLSMFLPWAGAGALTVTGLSITKLGGEFSNLGAAVHLIPLCAAAVLFQVGRGKSVHKALRLTFGFLPMILTVFAVIEVQGALAARGVSFLGEVGFGQMFGYLRFGYWLALVSGIVVVLKPDARAASEKWDSV